MTILDELAAHARKRTEQAKKQVPLQQLQKQAAQVQREPFAFEKALRRPGISVIAEVKRASPSRGLIAEDFPWLQIARDYEAAGADCISVLTEPKWFLGSDAYLKEIADTVSLPVLRKDFTVDPYMIWQAKALGADAVLLIVSLLCDEELQSFFDLAQSLGLTALVECHDAAEIQRALAIGARVIGVNNRDLKTFTVDTKNSRLLADLIPEDVIFVSESGTKTAEDVKEAAEFADAVLIGEALMKAADKGEKLKELKSLV